MRFLLVAFGLVPNFGMAEEWQRLLDDDAVYEIIAGRTIDYDPHTFQWFGWSGETQYVTDRFADGRWAARGGQYCSTWPPSDRWDCYDVQVQGNRIRFISADRSVSEGQFRK